MNTNRLIAAVIAVSAVFTTAGCRCQGPVTPNQPDYVANPTTLSFSACPTKDEMNRDVADVFPDEQKVKIQNLGKAGGTFSATLSGADSAQFKLDPMRTPMAVEPGDEVELPVQFSPAKKGDSRATVTIDDGDEETEKITVELIGTGKNLPAQPTLEAELENYASPTTPSICKDGSPLIDCQLGYPDTLLKDSNTLHIKLRNKGCPALKVTAIELIKGAGGADNMGFFLDSPARLPTATEPLVMSAADGTDEVTLTIRFAPESDGSGVDQRFGELTIRTNDPTTPVMQLSLSGNGVEPSIYAVPSFCNYNEAMDRCRPTGAKVTDEAVFEVTNGGSANVKIDSALFKSTNMATTGTNGRFTVMTPIDNTMLMPGQKATLTVKHNDMATFVIDQITVSASVPGMPAGSAGKIFLTVAGGTAPCLATEPDLSLDFNNPTEELTVKKVTVKNLATRPGSGTPCGDLVVEGAEIDNTTFFSIVAPMLTANQVIPKGQQADINVQYKKAIIGGMQNATLTLRTNDLDYAGPSYKKVLLQSQSPLNQIPVCVLKGCTPAMTDCSTMGQSPSMTVSLSQSFAPSAPKNLTIWGGDSYDPGNESMANKGIAQWKFQVLTPSPNVTGYMLPNNGVFATMSSTTLTLDPVATGLYKMFLYVKDASGQQNGGQCELRIQVNQ